ncbi:unnamed protein product [Prorocentrum cordatum]|uniref:Kinesin motor domain-containing protein n=1 Tax=Prorocentrum cordatum TaxID=2364126 RepID=A0ABN9WHQ5_9DINO|nr:unnamed protein product [Polarella glacialis]
MVACLSPSDKHYEENLSTLSYASQAASIKNTPTVNIDPKDRLIQQLEAKLAAAHAYILKHLGVAELPQSLLDAGDAALAKRPRARQFARSADKRERRGAEQVGSQTAPQGRRGGRL